MSFQTSNTLTTPPHIQPGKHIHALADSRWPNAHSLEAALTGAVPDEVGGAQGEQLAARPNVGRPPLVLTQLVGYLGPFFSTCSPYISVLWALNFPESSPKIQSEAVTSTLSDSTNTVGDRPCSRHPVAGA